MFVNMVSCCSALKAPVKADVGDMVSDFGVCTGCVELTRMSRQDGNDVLLLHRPVLSAERPVSMIPNLHCRTFLLNRERAVDYLNMLDRIYVFDGFAGWDPEVREMP